MFVPVPTLAEEIQQRAPFASAEVEAYLCLQRTADRLRHAVAELLRGQGLSPTGYNVLRILRGSGPGGLPCHEVGVRLVAHDPDITRLSDRLAEAGLISRERSRDDRRLVVLRITADGLAALAALEQPLVDLHRRQLGHLGSERLGQLIALLDAVRSPSL